MHAKLKEKLNTMKKNQKKINFKKTEIHLTKENKNKVKLKLKGKRASLGRINGKARIIKKEEDLKNIQKGEVIVLFNTTPVMIPLITKASALIAESPSLTCHAAIITRELNIPSIVGIKNAKEIINTGDTLKSKKTTSNNLDVIKCIE